MGNQPSQGKFQKRRKTLEEKLESKRGWKDHDEVERLVPKEELESKLELAKQKSEAAVTQAQLVRQAAAELERRRRQLEENQEIIRAELAEAKARADEEERRLQEAEEKLNVNMRVKEAHNAKAAAAEAAAAEAEADAIEAFASPEVAEAAKAKADAAAAKFLEAKQEADRFKLGTRVSVDSAIGRQLGTVAYVGKTEFGEGFWIGVSMDLAHGTNDGSVHGKSYFSCEPQHGVFARPADLRLVGETGHSTLSGPAKELFDQAKAEMEKENFEKAAELLQRAHETDPQNADVLVNLCSCFTNLDKGEEFEEYYSKLAELSTTVRFASTESELIEYADDGASFSAPGRSRMKMAERTKEFADQLKADLAFQRFDRDKDGVLSKSEVKRLAESLLAGHVKLTGHLSDEEVELIMRCGGQEVKPVITAQELPLALATVELLREHNKELTKLFARFDRDEDGLLNMNELARLLTHVNDGIPPTQADMMFILKQCEPRGADDPIGLRDLQPALACWYVLLSRPLAPDQVKAFFLEYDEDSSGEITRRDMIYTLCKLNPSMKQFDEHDWDSLFRYTDRDGDGKVKYADFVDWLMDEHPEESIKPAEEWC